MLILALCGSKNQARTYRSRICDTDTSTLERQAAHIHAHFKAASSATLLYYLGYGFHLTVGRLPGVKKSLDGRSFLRVNIPPTLGRVNKNKVDMLPIY
jgi:hypothetical protein